MKLTGIQKIIENIHLCVLSSVTSEHTPTSNTKCIYRAIRRRTELFYYIFAHNTVITDLAPQVAEANRGGPGKIKINEIC